MKNPCLTNTNECSNKKYNIVLVVPNICLEQNTPPCFSPTALVTQNNMPQHRETHNLFD
jgi:hypothetical protein